MTTKNIVIALICGAIIGAIGTAGVIWPEYAALCVSGSAIIGTLAVMVTGIQPKAGA